MFLLSRAGHGSISGLPHSSDRTHTSDDLSVMRMTLFLKLNFLIGAESDFLYYRRTLDQDQ